MPGYQEEKQMQLSLPEDSVPVKEMFERFLKRCEQVPEIVDVAIPEVALSSFDQLLCLGGVQ